MHLLRRSAAIAALLALGMGMSGCSDPSPSGDAAVPTAASPALPNPSDDAEVTVPDDLAGQTLWSIAGSGEALPDDDPDVQAVRTLVTVHSGAVDDRGPETVDRALEEEYSAYSPQFSATLDAVDWRTRSIARTLDRAVVSQQAGLAWMPSTISADRRSATAQYEAFIVFTAADGAFFAENDIQPGREYSMSRMVEAEKIDGVWLISDVRESSLRPRGEPDE